MSTSRPDLSAALPGLGGLDSGRYVRHQANKGGNGVAYTTYSAGGRRIQAWEHCCRRRRQRLVAAIPTRRLPAEGPTPAAGADAVVVS